MKYALLALLAACTIGYFAQAASLKRNADGSTVVLPDCKAGEVAGEPCVTTVDCHQCGTCDWYLACQENVWVEHKCDSKEADGRVNVSDKLFWNQGGNDHGGACVPFNLLDNDLGMKYRNDTTCKPECEFWGDNSTSPCLRRYFYSDPDFDLGIWNAKAEELYCSPGTKWDQDQEGCVYCKDTDDCNANCPP